MSYIGQRPVVGRYIKLDQISSGFNGSETSFSMTAGSQAVFPGTARNLLLSLGGVIQEPDTNFTISGSTLTFTTAPVANTTFFAVIFGDMQSTGTPSDGTVLPASIASSGNFSFPQLTVTGTSSLGDDVTFTGANYNAVWDKSDNALEFADNAKLRLGTGNDLEIYHDGSKSVIADTGTGGLFIGGSSISLTNSGISETMLYAVPDGAVELYYDNSKKLETTSTGVSITGNITASGGQLTLEDGNEEQIHRFWNNISDSDIHGLLSGSTFGTIVEGANNGHHVIALRGNDTSDSFAIISGGGNYTTDSTYDTLVARFYSNGVFHMPDNNSIKLGTSNDLQIYHDGSHSRIDDTGTGSLVLRSSHFLVEKYGGDYMISGAMQTEQ